MNVMLYEQAYLWNRAFQILFIIIRVLLGKSMTAKSAGSS